MLEITNKIDIILCPQSNNPDLDFVECTTEKMKYNYVHGGFARIKPFLLAKGRYMISKIIEKNLSEIVHCHTDGLIMKSKIKGFQAVEEKADADIGDLLYCGYDETCKVYNSCHYEFEPTK